MYANKVYFISHRKTQKTWRSKAATKTNLTQSREDAESQRFSISQDR